MHYCQVEDSHGELVELVPLCSDTCHRDYCERHGLDYAGWDGCHEGSDYPEWCAACGIRASAGLSTECANDCMPIVVAIIGEPPSGKCPHGYPHYIAPEGACST
jgi:hypothetical protein